MSETILRFFIDELVTIRVLCQNKRCMGVIEYQVDQLHDKFRHTNACPLCTAEFGGPEKARLLAELGLAFEHFKMVQDRIRVEFVLPAK